MFKSKTVRTIGITALVAAGTLTLTFGAGAALAGAPVFAAPEGLRAADGVATEPMASPDYKINANGETYGSLADASAPSNEPDLIAATADSGEFGYVKNEELDAATGADVKSPEEAIAWSLDGAKKDHVVNLYAVDGETIVGEFVVQGSDSAEASLSK